MEGKEGEVIISNCCNSSCKLYDPDCAYYCSNGARSEFCKDKIKPNSFNQSFVGGLIDPDAWIKKKFAEIESRIKTLEDRMAHDGNNIF